MFFINTKIHLKSGCFRHIHAGKSQILSLLYQMSLSKLQNEKKGAYAIGLFQSSTGGPGSMSY